MELILSLRANTKAVSNCLPDIKIGNNTLTKPTYRRTLHSPQPRYTRFEINSPQNIPKTQLISKKAGTKCDARYFSPDALFRRNLAIKLLKKEHVSPVLNLNLSDRENTRPNMTSPHMLKMMKNYTKRFFKSEEDEKEHLRVRKQTSFYNPLLDTSFSQGFRRKKGHKVNHNLEHIVTDEQLKKFKAKICREYTRTQVMA